MIKMITAAKIFSIISFYLLTQGSMIHSMPHDRLGNYGKVKDFSLVERSGKKVELKDLLGKAWIADFIFTRCEGPCPMLTSRMSGLQKEISPEVQLVSFSVDPEYDTPAILSRYADRYGAEPGRWAFLTGQKKEVYELLRNSFYIGVEENKESDKPEEGVIHSLKWALVDSKGEVRSYYDGNDPEDLQRIPRDLKWLRLEQSSPILLKLPSFNALLNSCSALLLLVGYRFIRIKKVLPHKICMGLAFFVSALFLCSYLVYHFKAGSVPFQKTGWIRPVYFTILISHTVLAALIVPLALTTFYRAWKNQIDKHIRVARWTLPIWLYVSVTGVTIYWMLYRL